MDRVDAKAFSKVDKEKLSTLAMPSRNNRHVDRSLVLVRFSCDVFRGPDYERASELQIG